MSGFLSRISRRPRKKEPIASVRNFRDDKFTSVSTNSSTDESTAAFADDSLSMEISSGDQQADHSDSSTIPNETAFPRLQNPQPHESVKSSEGACSEPPQASWETPGAHAMELPCQSMDPMDISVNALGFRTRKILSMHLNPPKITGNDWRGLADYMDFSQLEIDNFALREDPTGEVLRQWGCKASSTIGELKTFLLDLEREDALTDLDKYINKDVERWKKKNTEKGGKPVQVAEVSGSYPNTPRCPELRGITLNDHPDGPVQTFDAYICHNTETDYPFVQEILEKMEKSPYNLKFCTDWRDLVPGGSYVNVTAELIENRCKRMIVVLSPEFLQSEKCDFHIKFALSLSPGARSRRMVLVMLKQCEPPNILRFITVCDYTREALRPYFWPRLNAALNLC